MPQCCKQVHDGGRWPSFHRCKRAGVVTRDGKPFCRQHDPREVAKREAQRSAKWKAEDAAHWQQRRLAAAAPKLLAACEAVVEFVANQDLSRNAAQRRAEDVWLWEHLDAVAAQCREAVAAPQAPDTTTAPDVPTRHAQGHSEGDEDNG